MENSKTWQSGIVYQIYPRSFQDSNDDGIGDLQGIISRLSYIKELGADMIWLSPVYRSPNDDNGYDISDYLDINPEFGTMDDMDLLIVKAKELGLKIIMDLVINHTSDEHPWFVRSKAKDPLYRDYYIWQDKPNNWTSFFGGKAWSKYEDSYYLHLFSPKQPDLNWKNPKVMEEIQKIMHFWLKKGIYGFRCDVINIIYKTSLNNGKKHLVLTGKEHYHSQEGCHNILKTLREEVLSKYDCFTVGETVMVTTKQANDLILPERKELDMVFGFEHMETDQINNKWFRTKFKPNKWMKVISKWQKEVHWNANYMENHDQQRSVSRFGNDKVYHEQSAKMLGLINLTLKGTPYIYQGQEIGMTNVEFKDMSEFKDVETHRIDALAKRLGFPKKLRWKMMMRSSRDHARTPMQWDHTGGFTKGSPWIRYSHNFSIINVEDELKKPSSILSFYKQLIAFRKNNEVLINGSFEPLHMGKSLFIYERREKNQSYVVVANMGERYQKIPIKISGKILISNLNRNDLIDGLLKPYEAFILERGV